jgi:hypothetical protein
MAEKVKISWFCVSMKLLDTYNSDKWEHLEGGWIGDPVEFNN